MNRKLMVVCLLLLTVTGLAGAWLLLNPNDPSPSNVIGRKGAETSLQPEDTTEVKRSGHATGHEQPAPAVDDDAAGPDSTETDDSRQPGTRERQDTASRNDNGIRRGGGEQTDSAEMSEEELAAERARREQELRDISRPPNQNRGNVRPRARRLTTSGHKALSEVSEQLRQDRRGLMARYYAFSRPPLQDLLDPTRPRLEERAPDVTRIDRQVHFPSKDHWADLPFDLTNFMAVWEGFLVVPEAGDYWLFLGADLHARLIMGGETVLLNNGIDYTEFSTTLTLDEGLHPLRIEYTEARNNSPVSALGACNFMWVPEGETRPVPVPPEMLLLPERYWSDDAPIITGLNPTQGEIGDEIVINGRNFTGERDDALQVTFAGQDAEILDRSSGSVRVRVPIGAATGPVIVTRTGGDSGVGIPSNAGDFTVTTQFGLVASWHDLQGWRNYDFLEPGIRDPDVQRLERDFMFERRSDLDLPFRAHPLAATWEGKLGLAAHSKSRILRFSAHGRLRVKLGNHTRVTEALPGTEEVQTTLDFELPAGPEQYLPLSIEFTAEGGAASLQVLKANLSTEGQVVVDSPLQPQHFFPLEAPPQPPRIVSARAVQPDGVPAPELPFVHVSDRPSIREGQTFEFILFIYDDPEMPLTVTVDGKHVDFSVEWQHKYDNGMVERRCRAVLPDGLGEGRMVVRQSIVTSEPFYIDVLNKGLIAYLYKMPPGQSLSSLPDIEPLTCWLIRRDRQINFENANDFDLPFPAETFVVDWYGALIVEEEGDYTFTTRSDDGVIVWLNGLPILEDDSLHYQRPKDSEPIRLVPGVYPLRVQFFENYVHEVCVLYWRMSRNGEEVLPQEVIPKRNFTWDVHPPLPAKTSTGLYADGSEPE
jgi:hypothetical protein